GAGWVRGRGARRGLAPVVPLQPYGGRIWLCGFRSPPSPGGACGGVRALSRLAAGSALVALVAPGPLYVVWSGVAVSGSEDAARRTCPGCDSVAAGMAGWSVSGHLPVRQTWVCSSCGRPWPCHDAKVDLLAEYAQVPTALVLYIAAAFMECVVDLRVVRAEELYLRFLGWLVLRRPWAPDSASS